MTVSGEESISVMALPMTVVFAVGSKKLRFLSLIQSSESMLVNL
eukprot:CAMPEP_0197568266 /NCGR_PEP_ID=MMETSP1320-20131121/37032_1 /TAXON_ID=91990 /ORGANISM="Bolidomonas sp., Strain RCC2347" /LENGTH=43 /DNA_ID= /DNA_START= /DNA_END= /DNA_ORIENTATION=